MLGGMEGGGRGGGVGGGGRETRIRKGQNIYRSWRIGGEMKVKRKLEEEKREEDEGVEAVQLLESKEGGAKRE